MTSKSVQYIRVNPYPGGIFIRILQLIYRKLKRHNRVPVFDFHQVNSIDPASSYSNICNFIPATRRVTDIFKGVDKFPFLSVYVHGSWADDTRTEFSDLDDLIIIDSFKLKTRMQSVRAEAWLNKVDMRFCRIDPLQHHGHWIITSDSLDNLDGSYMPLTVLNNAMLVQGSNNINYKTSIAITRIGLLRNIESTLDNISTKSRYYLENNISAFQMKELIGSFLLMPAYLIQFKGTDISKKQALEQKATIFGPECCHLLDKCSQIRSDWHLVTSTFRFKLLRLASYFFTNPHLFRLFSKRYFISFPHDKFPTIFESEVNLFVQEVRNVVRI